MLDLAMPYIADLHLHSAYAYATSKSLTLENLTKWAKIKGIDLLASADFTHPAWFDELNRKLSPDGGGLYQFDGVHFVLGTEVSCVYQQGGRQRRVHMLLFAPDLDTVSRLNLALAGHGNLKPDGRPTLTMSARDLTALTLEINPNCIVLPAHAWTPWYGVFGSKSGFDSLEECFLDMTPAITAIETGLSSDPEMNWGVGELSNKTIVSFSDAHSLPKLAREVTALLGPLTYPGLAEALSQNRVAYTVEFYPEEGKYHYDGHRKCGVCQPPAEILRQTGPCPVCGRPLTLGVLNRTGSLSNGKVAGIRGGDGFIQSPDGRPPFIKLVPLQEIIAEVMGQGPSTKKVQIIYLQMIEAVGSELQILINATEDDLARVSGERIAQAILQVRAGDIQVEPGYDGVFGKVSIGIPESTTPVPKIDKREPPGMAEVESRRLL
ncbi:MAG: endonuclease Q family protein [Chloroflexi bacterium]|nr:endonuclease Q family protein [Chloroflexota bacterium]PKB57687.1 MAG: hypothetical protein BZY73_01970 [SAR202 cluster bacterium Casp-Chloro-G3]